MPGTVSLEVSIAEFLSSFERGCEVFYVDHNFLKRHCLEFHLRIFLFSLFAGLTESCFAGGS